jgi:two-component system sensor histidine kinase/response regulator
MTNSNVQGPADRHRQLFDEAPIAYHEIDTHGVIRDVNRAQCELLGYSPEQMIGRPIWDFVAAENQQAARDAIAGKVARMFAPSVVTREFRRSDGNYLWVEIHDKLIENGEREVIGVRSALLDVTGRLKLEAEIRKQSDWIRFTFNSTARGVIIADALGNISLMNPAAESLTGWRHDEAVGCPLERVCRLQRDSGEPVDLMSCILAEPAQSDPNRNFVMIDRAGESQPVSWTVSPIRNDDEVIVGATLVVEKL